MSEVKAGPSRNRELSDEIDEVGAAIVEAHGILPKYLALVTRLCRVRDELRLLAVSETGRNEIIEECANATVAAAHASGIKSYDADLLVKVIRALKNAAPQASPEQRLSFVLENYMKYETDAKSWYFNGPYMVGADKISAIDKAMRASGERPRE